MRTRIHPSGIILTWSALLVCGTPAVGAVRYTVTDLGTLGGSSSRGCAINNLGQVTGIFVNPQGSTHAFLYSDGSMADLGTAGGSYTFAYGINNLGQITGTGDAGGAGRIVLYRMEVGRSYRVLNRNSLTSATASPSMTRLPSRASPTFRTEKYTHSFIRAVASEIWAPWAARSVTDTESTEAIMSPAWRPSRGIP